MRTSYELYTKIFAFGNNKIYNQAMENMKRYMLPVLIALLMLTGCGKSKTEHTDGQASDGYFSGVDNFDGFSQNPEETYLEGSSESEGTAVFADEEYNTFDKENSGRIEVMKSSLNDIQNVCRDIYVSADKGGGFNVVLSDATVAELMNAIAGAGYSVCDSNYTFNMQGYEALDDFGKSILQGGNISGRYYVVYSDGHISAFELYREGKVWHLLAMSAAWEDDGTLRIFSQGRYSVGTVKYTTKGWLIYNRNTTDFDDNQKSNTGEYTMVRVLPYDSYKKQLAARYIEPVGYLENNLFITDWNTANLGPVDFNTLYAYLFGMYNGTEMLSSYNVRSYYKATGGTRLYVIPTDTFETTVQTYFDIDGATLKNISDFSWKYGGYFFLGYNRDYFNVIPRTPFPEVVDYKENPNGTITMTVDAVNDWYGTDCAFRHVLTVRPEAGGFKYVSNELVQNDGNILPDQKLAEMTDVEMAKLK